MSVRSPKRSLLVSRGEYYQYYAGYSEGFVQDMLTQVGCTSADLVLDPWNGSGTTTRGAALQGVAAIGYDINPVTVLIARSRLLDSAGAGDLTALANDVCDEAIDRPYRAFKDDLLNTWFGATTAAQIRSIERAINNLLVTHEVACSRQPIYDSGLPQTPLASSLYAALFSVARGLLRKYVPSNPTWIKKPTGPKLGIRGVDIHLAFKSEVERLSRTMSAQQPMLTDFEYPEKLATVELGASTALPLDDASVSAVISSPPYCTRLDYVKATLPELATLGLLDPDVRVLRDQMIGTPTMNKDLAEETGGWGNETKKFLARVERHQSRASSTYYTKYYRQYFAGMYASLAEISRVVKPKGSAVLVIQDSYYKELHLDLPGLIADMACGLGWTLKQRLDFTVPHNFATINPGSRRYRERTRATESAIVLERS